MSALEETKNGKQLIELFSLLQTRKVRFLSTLSIGRRHTQIQLYLTPENLWKNVAFSSLSKRQLSGTLRNGIFSAQEASKTELPAGSVLIKSRTSIELAAGQHVSLCTFFNAFPASYWQRWTKVTNVRFIAKVGGVGRIVVMKSSARGIPSTVATIPVAQEDEFVEADISLSGFMDGGFIWA